MMSRTRRGMGRPNVMGGQADHGGKAVKDLFEKLEPFFNGVLVEMKTFDMKDRATYTSYFNHLNAHTQNNIYDDLINAFKERIKKGFDESIRYLQQFPYDENFPKHIKNELDKFLYAKRVILSLFQALKFGAATGSGISIEKIVNEHWNTDYLKQLNEMLNLTKELTNIFSTSRRNGNTQTVLPVKTILKYYEDNDNSPSNNSGIRLIPEFLAKFKENAIDDYKKLQVDYMTGGIHLFLKNSLKFITDEDYRLENALIDCISEELKPLLVTEYINKAYDVVHENYKEIIEKNDDEEFQAIVKLFERVDKLKPFAKKTGDAFVVRCQKKIADEIEKVNVEIKNNPKGTVVPLHTNAEASMNLFFEFYDQYVHFRDVSFMKNFDFSQQLHNAVETILTTNDLINQTGEGDNFIPKLLAAYMNKLLRKGSKVEVAGKSKEEIIKTVCAILDFIRGKDVFLKQYLKNLQDRLIYALVESNDYELAAINNIEKVCERSEVDKLHKTFAAYDSSTQENERFKNHCLAKKLTLPKIDFSCMVFSMTSGDNGTTVDKFNNFKHNDHCMTLFNAYKDFYLGTSSGGDGNNKKLNIDTARSWGVITFKWMKRNIEITAKYPQMVIMMLFNDKQTMNYAEIGTMTGMEPDILGYFLSGIVSKTLLTCSTPNEFNPESEFKFNMGFKPKTTKINVFQPDKKYSEKEDKENNEKLQQEIDESRALVIQARQVRIMKQRRTMKYIDLINENVESLRTKFNVTSRMARRQIEFLINKEYFKRSESDREVLEYIA